MAPLERNCTVRFTHGEIVFHHACKLGLECIVSNRLGARYHSGRSKDRLKFKNPAAPAVKRETEEDWGARDGGETPRSAV
jgi:ATP-dependent DNA ligase